MMSENEIRARKGLPEFAKQYNIDPKLLQKLYGGYENTIFGHNEDERGAVLRITPSSHRTLQQIRAEIDWLSYLTENGVSAVCPQQSVDGNIVETIEYNGSYMTAVCFEYASGRLATPQDFNEDLFRNWGQLMGRIHSLTKNYSPEPDITKRWEWYEDSYLNRESIPSNQVKVLERFDSVIEYIRDLPINNDSYGLIHMDMHHQNLFLDGKKITLLDFDDCQYGFFILDIANTLGFSIWEKNKNETNREFATRFLDCFMEGYERENQLDDVWMENLPTAMKVFEFIHYIAFNQDYDLAGNGSFEELDSKTQNTLARYILSIEKNLDYIDNTFCPYT